MEFCLGLCWDILTFLRLMTQFWASVSGAFSASFLRWHPPHTLGSLLHLPAMFHLSSPRRWPQSEHTVCLCASPRPDRPQCRDLTPPCVLPAPQVPRSEASTFSNSHHVAYFEASAKLRLNVDEAFEQLVRAVR